MKNQVAQKSEKKKEFIYKVVNYSRIRGKCLGQYIYSQFHPPNWANRAAKESEFGSDL